MPYKDPEKQKEAQHASYIRNKNRILERQKAKRLEHRETSNRLKDKPCMDCKVKYPPYVMDFDHRDPTTKLFNIAGSSHRNTEKYLAEIAKCDLVCSNCHRERTHKKRIPHE